MADRSAARPCRAIAAPSATSAPPSRALIACARRPNPSVTGPPVRPAAAHRASNTTCDGCFGAPSSSGAESNRADNPAGKYACTIVASSVSAIRAHSVRTNRCANRFGASSAANRPSVVFAATICARPAAVRGPVLAPPCIWHHPFNIASPRHEPPARVRAPHQGVRAARRLSPRPPAMARRSRSCHAPRSREVGGDGVVSHCPMDRVKGYCVAEVGHDAALRLKWTDVQLFILTNIESKASSRSLARHDYPKSRLPHPHFAGLGLRNGPTSTSGAIGPPSRSAAKAYARSALTRVAGPETNLNARIRHYESRNKSKRK